MITRRDLLGQGMLLCGAGCLPDAPSPPAVERRSTAPAAGPTPEQVPRPFVLGLMPVLEPEAIRSRYGAFADFLGDALGTRVELRIAESYGAAIAAAVEGRVDLAQLSPLAYVEAHASNEALSPLVTNISEGSSTYSGYLVAQRHLHIVQSRDLVGRKIGFVDENSASGYLYPYAFLVANDIDPRRHCRPTLLGRHDRVIDALVADHIDVGATFSGSLNYAELRGIDTRGLEIVAKTGRIPHDAWVARPSLAAEAQRAVQRILLNVSTRTAEGRRVLEPIRSINGFTPARDDHYDAVRAKRREVSAAVKATGS